MTSEEIKTFLPKYLSEVSTKVLIDNLKIFPNNIDKRFYTNKLESNVLFQGDGLSNLTFVNINTKEFKQSFGIILSNTCDIELSNVRISQNNILYAPIFNLANYKNSLKIKNSVEKVNNHIDQIKKQKITQILFLPKYSDFDDSIVFLDKINNISNESVNRNTIIDERKFSLSDYGFYLFLFKLSIHFNRLQENVDRSGIFH